MKELIEFKANPQVPFGVIGDRGIHGQMSDMEIEILPDVLGLDERKYTESIIRGCYNNHSDKRVLPPSWVYGRACNLAFALNNHPDFHNQSELREILQGFSSDSLPIATSSTIDYKGDMVYVAHQIYGLFYNPYTDLTVVDIYNYGIVIPLRLGDEFPMYDPSHWNKKTTLEEFIRNYPQASSAIFLMADWELDTLLQTTSPALFESDLGRDGSLWCMPHHIVFSFSNSGISGLHVIPSDETGNLKCGAMFIRYKEQSCPTKESSLMHHVITT